MATSLKIDEALNTSQSAILAIHGEVKRGKTFMEPKAPLTCGGESPTARSEFFKGRVQQLAGRRRRSPHWIMLEAIQQYVEREEARDSVLRQAMDSWASYQETGLHVTGQEVRAWLETWGTDEETAAPACHT